MKDAWDAVVVISPDWMSAGLELFNVLMANGNYKHRQSGDLQHTKLVTRRRLVCKESYSSLTGRFSDGPAAFKSYESFVLMLTEAPVTTQTLVPGMGPKGGFSYTVQLNAGTVGRMVFCEIWRIEHEAIVGSAEVPFMRVCAH
jgi:hypothetical protein